MNASVPVASDSARPSVSSIPVNTAKGIDVNLSRKAKNGFHAILLDKTNSSSSSTRARLYASICTAHCFDEHIAVCVTTIWGIGDHPLVNTQ
jgi:hypothetical protein